MMKSTTPTTSKRKQSATCDTCDIMFSSDQDLYAHLLTKDHMMASAENTQLRRPFLLNDPSLTVVVEGFSPRTSLYDLENAFKQYGEIRQLIFTKITSSEAGCLVEFTKSSSVDAALKKMPMVNGRKLPVQKYSIHSLLVRHSSYPSGENSHKKICTDSESVKPSSSNSRATSKPVTTMPTSQRNGTANENSQPSSDETNWSGSSSSSKDKSDPGHSSSKFKKTESTSPADKLLKGIEKIVEVSAGSEAAKQPEKNRAEPEKTTSKPETSKASRSTDSSKVPEKTARLAESSQSKPEERQTEGPLSTVRQFLKNLDHSTPEVPTQPRVKIDDKLYDEEIVGFVRKLQASLPSAQAKYDEVFDAVERAMGLLRVPFECFLFGSSFTGLCWEGADLDIYIQWGQEVLNPDVVLSECRKALYRNGNFQKVIIIRARTPLIKCQHRKHELDCDISFKSRLGVFNSCLIKIYVAFDARVRPMIVFLKYWGRENEVIGSNRINSYCLSWMIIYFLQQQNILPTVEYLNNFTRKPSSYFGWDISFIELQHTPALDHVRDQYLLVNCYKEKSIRQLLIEFFDFYLTFDYARNVICPLIGTTIPRSSFEKLTDLPPVMAQFVRECKTQRMSRPEDFMFDRAKTLCLQDPIELTFNVGKCVSPKLKDHFKLCCKTATQILITEKVESVVPKLIAGQKQSLNKEREAKMGQEKVSQTVDDFLRTLKKSYCHTISMRPDKVAITHNTPFNKSKWVSDLFAAVVYILHKIFKFEISAFPKNLCTDLVLNKKYLQLGDHLDLEHCQVIYCEGYSIMLDSLKKTKSISLPRAMSSKYEIEKEAYRSGEALDRELKQRPDDQKHKFCLVFCFNPLKNEDCVHITHMRYFKFDSMPGVSDYQHFFNYSNTNLIGLINRALHFVQTSRSRLNLGSKLTLICADYDKGLNPVLPTSSNSTSNQTAKTASKGTPEVVVIQEEGESSVPSTKEVGQSKEDDVPSKKNSQEIKMEASSADPGSDDSDSDIEIVPVEPKVFECIDVE